MKIYYKDNQYYLKIGNIFYLADIVLKKHTILINQTSEYVTSLEGATELEYREVKNRFIKRESADVDSLKFNERSGKNDRDS